MNNIELWKIMAGLVTIILGSNGTLIWYLNYRQTNKKIKIEEEEKERKNEKEDENTLREDIKILKQEVKELRDEIRNKDDLHKKEMSAMQVKLDESNSKYWNLYAAHEKLQAQMDTFRKKAGIRMEQRVETIKTELDRAMQDIKPVDINENKTNE